MKAYELDTPLTFGKYKGYDLLQVFINDPSYIDWCIRKLDHFTLEEWVYDELLEHKPDFEFSAESLEKLRSNWEPEDDYWDFDPHENDDPYEDWERDSFDAMTDGQYGSYDDFMENGGDWDRMMDGMGY